MQVRFFNFDAVRQDPRFAAAYSRFGGRPGWVWRASFLVAAVVFVIPLIVFALAAVFAFTAVFLLLSLVSAVGDFFSRALGGRSRDLADPIPADDGRRNVRVIRPD